jgi:hypothetical protein
MKKLLLAAWILTVVTTSPAMRVYWIGNSVTDALKYGTWKQTAEADGRSIIWGRTMIPGAPIHWLWDHPDQGISEPPFDRWSIALKDYVWDVVSLQPYDGGIDEWTSADVPNINKFMNYTKPKSPDVQFVLFAHYPRQDYINASGSYQQHWDKPYKNTRGGNETREFYKLVVEKVRALRTDMKPIVLVPVGEVYYQLDKKMKAGQFPGKTGIVAAAYADGIHQNDFGNYIVGCTYYATMFMTNPTGFSGSRYGVSDQHAAIIQQTVWQVVTSTPLAGVTPTRVQSNAAPRVLSKTGQAKQPAGYMLDGRVVLRLLPDTRSYTGTRTYKGTVPVLTAGSSGALLYIPAR